MIEDRLQNWFNAVEDVPANVQRYVTKMKMIDHHYELILKEIDDTEDENELARLLIRLHNLTDIKRELTSKINDHFSDATEAVKLEFRIIEHESQHMDKKEKHKNTDELSPNKRKDGNSSKPGKHKRSKVLKPESDKPKTEKEKRPGRTSKVGVNKGPQKVEKVKDEEEKNDKEETYCFCSQVSYGLMIGCDNAKCEIGWFHFSCVGLQHKPKGKWFCTCCKQTGKQQPHRGRKRKDSDNDH